MIIQPTSPPSLVMQSELRLNGAAAVKTVVEPTPQAAPQISMEALESAVSTLNLAMQQSNQSLEFSVDTNTQRTVVKMVDTNTGELIRQFPSEATLAISRGIDQFQQGLLLTNQA